MGNVFVLGGAVNLVPIVLVAAGVTIVVAVTVHVAEEAIEAARRRRKVEKECKELLVECLNNRWQPEWNRGRYGNEKECGACFRHCIRHGKWHDEACPRPN
jgi:hypothetical protein